jgi:hypothetical protein
VRLAAEDGKLVCVLLVGRRRQEYVIRDAGRVPGVGIEEDLLGFRLEMLNYRLEFKG